MWSENKGLYMPSDSTVETLPSGMYEVQMAMFGVLLKKVDVQKDGDFVVFGKRKETLMCVEKFRESQAKYDKYGFSYKRGYLFFGPPGTGKTALVREIVKKCKNSVGVIVSGSPNMLRKAYDLIRSQEPDRTIIFVMEDIEGYSGMLTTILDGAEDLTNMIVLGTTNYIGDIAERVIRPGRFDELILIDVLDEEERFEYIQHIFTDISKTKAKEYVKKTKGLSIAEIKNRVIEMVILGKNGDMEGHDAELKKLTAELKRSRHGGSQCVALQPEGWCDECDQSYNDCRC